MSVVRNRLPSEKAIVAAQLQVVASIPRHPCTCLHIFTQVVSEESGRALTGATKTHSIGSLLEGICVIIESNCIAQDDSSASTFRYASHVSERAK